jgi:ADP-ribose pyrophosphatase
MANKDHKYQQTDVKLINRQTLHQGFFKLEQLRLQHRLFAGGWSPILNRELLSGHASVAVLLFDPHLNQVVLIEQFRVGALSSSTSPWLLELVAGIVEPNETLEQVARREAQEEANCQIKQLMPICSYYPSPGGSLERTHLYCGQVDAKTSGGIHGIASEGEDIKVQVMDTEHAWQQLAQGIICNAATIIALQWLKLNHQSLVTKWCHNSQENALD